MYICTIFNDLTKKLEKVGPFECDELEKYCRASAKCYPSGCANACSEVKNQRLINQNETSNVDVTSESSSESELRVVSSSRLLLPSRLHVRYITICVNDLIKTNIYAKYKNELCAIV